MKHLQFIAAFLLLMGVSYSSAAQSFSDPVQINADLSHVNSPSAVHVLDIDGDGDEDVLVASVISQSLGLFRNNGDATFGHEYLSQGKAWYAVSSTDWDGDGNLDVVGVRVFGNIKGIEVFHNLAGNGPADQFDNADIVNAWPYSAGNDALQVGDVDEDGNPEIYHFGNDGDEGGVLIAERVGDQVNAATYKVDLTPGSDNETYDGFLMDGNGDGSKDFFLNRTVNAQVFWIAFNGTNINGLPVADVTTTYEGPAFCCSAGPKLASSSVFTTTGNQGSIKHWQYNGLNAGDGSDWTTETALSGNGFNAERAQTYLNYTWVDVDGDGNKDLLIGDPTNDTILYWPNNGNADFGDAFTIGDSQILATNIAYPSFLDFVDLNGDNAKDILFVDSVGDQLFWLESQVAPAAETTTITANPIAITADGQSTSTITVQAKDANGNNLAAGGDAVVLATTLGALGAIADNNDGTYTATLTAGVVAGTATITGTINGAAITDDADVAFNVGAAAAATTTITANPIAITADGQSTSTITVQAKDANGNNLQGGGDAVVLATTLGALGAVADNNDGTYTATLTAGVVAGTATITGTINGAAITDDADVAFNVGAAAAATTTITANPIAITADGQSTSTITVQAKDANGNNLQGGGDAVVLATTLGALGAVADNNDGTYTATLTAGVVAGTATITGTINGAAITDDADVAFNVGAAAAATTTITANPIAITADGQSTSTITVQAKDANGNNLAAGGDAVVLATTLGALGAVADNNDGTYTATLTAGVVAGTATITGTINGAAITDDADVAFNVGAAAAATTTITANPIAITADGQSTSTITVQAKDANGNNLAAGGDAVVLATTLGALGAVADNNDGTYTATLTAGVVAGTATITGTINGAAITDDADVAFNVGAAAAATTTITANPIAITADGQSTSTITVQAKDANGNNLAAGGDAVVLATTLGALGAVADNGDGTYTATLTSANQVGDATITGTINGAAITDDATVAMQAAAAAAATTTITANPIAITADGQSTSTITVQAKDANGNNLAAGGDAVVLATTLGALGAVADNNDGTYTATLTAGVVAGTATITGTINGAAITDDADVAFNVGAAAAATTTITANPIAITADGQSTSTITVQAKDANGNNLAAGGDAVVLATTLGALGAVADNNDGTYTATLTAGVVAGTATITGTINGAAITDDADVTLNVGAAGSSVSLVQTSTTPDGDSVYTITIAVTDSDGNNVGTGGDDVSIASTVGVLSEVIDNQDGTYTATLTTSPQEGMAVITITVNGADNSTSTEVTLGPGDANAGRTTISANPLSIVADGQSTSTITIQAKDADGHNLADGGDAVVLATTLGSLGSVVDNLDGTYTATLTAGLQAGTAQIVGFINSDLISSTAQISFTEPNSAPVAVIEASVTSGRAPLEVILDGHSSSDANGDLLTYEWDLGDGTSSQEILITHIFEEGIFDVLLVVSDGNLTDSASVIIEVDMANIAPEAVITASSYVGQAPFLVDFSASASSDANGDSLGFSWDMGDGATRIGESVSHTYGAPGLFTVVLTVTDGSLSDNAEAEISVASGVSVEDSKLPAEVVLKAIYPNPFNLTTMVTYGLPSASKVRITATDLLGRQVATLVAGDMKAAGYHTVQLNADGLASGTYLILIEAGDFVASQQVVLLK